MLKVFFDYRDEVHYEFLPTNQIVNSLIVMRRLRDAIRRK